MIVRWLGFWSPCCQDAASLAKSTSFEQSILNKKRRKKEQEERARFERERENEQRQREKEEKLRQERERQQQKLKKLGSNDSISIGCEFCQRLAGALNTTFPVLFLSASPPLHTCTAQQAHIHTQALHAVMFTRCQAPPLHWKCTHAHHMYKVLQ